MTHSKAMHTDYSLSSAHNTNAQLLDFDAPVWVLDVPAHDMKLVFLNDLHQAKAPTPQAETSEMLTKPHLPTSMMLLSMLPNQPHSSAQQLPPSPGATHLHQPPQCSGAPSTLSPSPLMMKRTTSNS